MKYDALAPQCIKIKSLCKMWIRYWESQWLSHRRCSASLHTEWSSGPRPWPRSLHCWNTSVHGNPLHPSPWLALTVLKTKERATTKPAFKPSRQILGSAHNDPPSLPVTSVTGEAEEHLAPVLCCLGSACAFDLGQVASSFACQFPLWIIITILALREGIPEFTRLW